MAATIPSRPAGVANVTAISSASMFFVLGRCDP